MLRVSCLVLAAGLTALAPAAVHACDSTACAAAMRYSDGSLDSGQWRIDVSARHVDQSRRFYGSQSIGQVYRPRVDLAGGGFEAASHQELGASMTFMQLELSRGITGSLSAYVSLPLYRSTTIDTVHIQAPVVGDTVVLPPGHEHTGDPVGTAISVQNRGSGIGDLQLGLRHVVWSSGPRQMTAGVTVKLPTGSTKVAGSDGVVDPMLQPGTGAADFVGLLQYAQKLGGTSVNLTASLQKAMTSDANYRYGDDVVVAGGAGRALSPKVTVQVQVKGQRSSRHHFRDSAVPSTGLTLVQVAPGARVRVRPDLSLYATMQIPAYVRVNESQLGPRATLTAGFVKAF
jgi:hypothetical protein